MSITLSDGVTTLSLNPDLYWEDEFSWNPVEQAQQRTITGALIVSVTARQKGRPFTLRPEDEKSGAMRRSEVQQLKAWADVPGQELTLNLRGVAYNVMFRHQDGGLTAEPWIHYSDADPDDFYFCIVRLLEIEPS